LVRVRKYRLKKFYWETGKKQWGLLSAEGLKRPSRPQIDDRGAIKKTTDFNGGPPSGVVAKFSRGAYRGQKRGVWEKAFGWVLQGLEQASERKLLCLPGGAGFADWRPHRVAVW